jgi:hypothetical protein
VLFSFINPAFVLSGLLVGFLVGQTGVGGGSLMTPLLVLVFGIHPTSAVGTDLLFASLTKVAGTGVHGFNRTIDWRITRLMAYGSVPATGLMLWAISQGNITSPGAARAITLTLGAMLLLTSMSLLFRARFVAALGPIVARLSPTQADRATIFIGFMLGALVTLTSVGAGALGVTALLLLYPRHKVSVIVGSDIAHAVPITMLAGLGHWWLGSVDGMLLISLLCGSIPGVIMGSALSARLPEPTTRIVLAVTLIVVGTRLFL